MRPIRNEVVEYFGEEIEDNCPVVVASSGELIFARTLKDNHIKIQTKGTHICLNRTYLQTTYPNFFLKGGEYGTNGKSTYLIHTIVFFTFCKEEMVHWIANHMIDHMNRVKDHSRFENLQLKHALGRIVKIGNTGTVVL